MHEKWEIRDHNSEERIILGQNLRWFKVLRERSVLGREKRSFLSREIEEKWIWFRVGPI